MTLSPMLLCFRQKEDKLCVDKSWVGDCPGKHSLYPSKYSCPSSIPYYLAARRRGGEVVGSRPWTCGWSWWCPRGRWAHQGRKDGTSQPTEGSQPVFISVKIGHYLFVLRKNVRKKIWLKGEEQASGKLQIWLGRSLEMHFRSVGVKSVEKRPK